METYPHPAYSVRLCNIPKDGERIVDLLTRLGYANVTVPKIQGVGMVAETDEEPKEIIGFFWALVGHSTTCYFDYLAVDPRFKPREDIAIDLCIALLGLLQASGVQEMLAAVQSTKVLETLRLLGFKDLEKHTMVKGSMEDVANRLNLYFNANRPQETGALAEVANGV